MPLPSSSLAVSGVRPKPPAAFSALAMTMSILYCWRMVAQVFVNDLPSRLTDDISDG